MVLMAGLSPATSARHLMLQCNLSSSTAKFVPILDRHETDRCAQACTTVGAPGKSSISPPFGRLAPAIGRSESCRSQRRNPPRKGHQVPESQFGSRTVAFEVEDDQLSS